MAIRERLVSQKALFLFASFSVLYWAGLYFAHVFDLYRPYLNAMKRQIDDYYLAEAKRNRCHDELRIKSTLTDWSAIRESCKANGIAKEFTLADRREVELGTHMIFLSATELEYVVQRGDRSFREVWTVGKLGLVKAKLRGEP
jgi:hypothetical protein